MYTMAGGSLGGIVNGVSAAVMPDVSANAPIVAGAGLADISTRAPTGGTIEAMHGKVMSPMIMGRPQEDGTLKVTQYVNNFTRMNQLTIGTLDSVPSGGRVVVTNHSNGEVRNGWIPADGTFRVSIPCDALDYFEKRVMTGMPDTGPEEGVIYSVEDNAGLGDELLVEVFDAQGTLVGKFDTFEVDAKHEGRHLSRWLTIGRSLLDWAEFEPPLALVD